MHVCKMRGSYIEKTTLIYLNWRIARYYYNHYGVPPKAVGPQTSYRRAYDDTSVESAL